MSQMFQQANDKLQLDFAESVDYADELESLIKSNKEKLRAK